LRIPVKVVLQTNFRMGVIQHDWMAARLETYPHRPTLPNLSRLVEEAAGEEIIIAKAGKPVARLVALEKPAFHRAYGALKGRIHASDDFDAPLPPEILKGFGIDE
jgi:antitoxin (DNA-binding transcriptional repressor) of toxin-antitoxin stability system